MVAVPKMMMFWVGRRSMIMLKVSQMFARANHVKIREKMLYCNMMIRKMTVIFNYMLTKAWTWKKNMRMIPCPDL